MGMRQKLSLTQSAHLCSCTGEQSVGKSFALNHLCDTSFAGRSIGIPTALKCSRHGCIGSAMRTTEGVWMSVNPTEDALMVALDFEGTCCFTFILKSIFYLHQQQVFIALSDPPKRIHSLSFSTLPSPIWLAASYAMQL